MQLCPAHSREQRHAGAATTDWLDVCELMVLSDLRLATSTEVVKGPQARRMFWSGLVLPAPAPERC